MNVLVDTSVWVDHLRSGNDSLERLLNEGLVLGHPYVIGEIACGRLRDRARVLGLLQALPQSPLAVHGEVLALIEERELAGRGIGWVDMHLLASSLLAQCTLWTFDKPLQTAVRSLQS